jgi:hypothetical protein
MLINEDSASVEYVPVLVVLFHVWGLIPRGQSEFIPVTTFVPGGADSARVVDFAVLPL